MKSNQMFVADASTFTAKSGNAAFILQAVHYDRFDHIKAEGVFCSESVFNQFSGPGIYDCEFVYGGGIQSMKKVQAVTI